MDDDDRADDDGAHPAGAEEAVAELARTTAQPYELIGRLAGGETGAHEVTGPAGERLVVKWEAEPASQRARRGGVAMAERLRVDAGWPVPRQRIITSENWLFVLQEFMPGATVEVIGHAMVDRLLELHDRRLGLARPGDEWRWPEVLVSTLTVGGRGYCQHEPLRGHDHRTAAVAARIEEVGRSIGPDDLPGGDIVHWDLHPGNILQEQGALSAIIDTDFATVGDAALDLVLLAVTSLGVACDSGVRSRLFAVAFDELAPVRRRAYVSHVLLRLLDWSIRRERTGEIEFWLARADELLDP